MDVAHSRARLLPAALRLVPRHARRIEPQLYQATPFPLRGGSPLAFAIPWTASSGWPLLCATETSRPTSSWIDRAASDRQQTLSIGVVPSLTEPASTLPPGSRFGPSAGHPAGRRSQPRRQRRAAR